MYIDIRRNRNINRLVFLQVCNAPDYRDSARLEQWIYNVGMFLHNQGFLENGEMYTWIPKALVDAGAPLKNHTDTEYVCDKYCIILDEAPPLVDYGTKAETHYLCAMHQLWNTPKQKDNAIGYTYVDRIIILVSTVFMLPVFLLVIWTLRFLATGSL